MCRILVACLFLFPIVATAQSDATPTARAEIVRKRTLEAIAWLTKEEPEQKKSVANYKRAVVRPNVPGIMSGNPIQVPSKEVKAKEVARAEQQLAETRAELKAYKAGEKFSFGTLELPPKLGEFGMLSGGGAHVIQVLGKDSMLIQKSYFVDVQRPMPYKVTLMVQDVSTKGIVDASGWNTTAVFEVVDTKTYQTADGTNTVFVIKPLDTAPIEAELRKPRPLK